MGLLFRLVCLCVLVGVAQQPRVPDCLRSGDIVFQASKSSRAQLIRRATGSPYSHVGLIEVANDGIFVIEAIEPVSRTPFETWRKRGIGTKIMVLRDRSLDEKTLAAVVAEAKSHLGTHYDARYRWDDERLYCSELVVKAYARAAKVTVGEMQALSSLSVNAKELAYAKSLGIEADTNLVTPASVAADARFSQVMSDF